MSTTAARIEPPEAVLTASRAWLAPVRAALGPDFVAAHLTGSVLRHGFDPKHSHVNVLVVARQLDGATLDRIAGALPSSKRPPHFDPLFMTPSQITDSLDVFPIEWLDLRERHFRLEGEDLLAALEVSRTGLRAQCEHELRGKHLRLRHEYLGSARKAAHLREVLVRIASGFHALFRTVIRLRGEEPPPRTDHAIERVAAAYGLDAGALLGPHRLKHGERPDDDGTRRLYLAFMAEIERLIDAVDGLDVR
ncbi:MAG TPA: hypothetical protein VMH61_07585 [Candidatus Acidoferrales bacterium]|nr:hypothetical protein [Candidatus Acidoferrales bacterium]